jgi:TM2 domain-containing membrane protein YozV
MTTASSFDQHDAHGSSIHPLAVQPVPDTNRSGSTEFCSTCGGVMEPSASNCTQCGSPRLVGNHFCWHCATPIPAGAGMCSACGAGLHGSAARAGANETVKSKRILAAALAFFTGAFGIHKFYLGQPVTGLIRLGISFVLLIPTLGLAIAAMAVIGMVEAVIYATQSDADFIRIYQRGRKGWF